MTTTSEVDVTPGSGKNIATYSFIEDAKTKELQRFTPSKGDGSEIDLGALLGALPKAAAGSDGSGSIAAGGVAQNLFAGATPTNGFEIHNPDPAEDLWISISVTAAPDAQGSINVAAGGGKYTTPPGMRPFHAISVIGATTGHKFTAHQW